MNIFTDVDAGQEKTFYTLQTYLARESRWVAIKDFDREWDAISQCNSWNELSIDMHRVVEVTCKVNVCHSDYPDYE